MAADQILCRRFLIFIEEWRATNKKLESHTSNRPHIDTSVIFLVHDHLRRRIIQRPIVVEGLAVDGDAKISQLYDIFVRDEDVCWLYVAVDYAPFVQMTYCSQELLEDVSYLLDPAAGGTFVRRRPGSLGVEKLSLDLQLKSGAL